MTVFPGRMRHGSRQSTAGTRAREEAGKSGAEEAETEKRASRWPQVGNGVNATENSSLRNNLGRSWRLPPNQPRRAKGILQSWKRVDCEEAESSSEERW